MSSKLTTGSALLAGVAIAVLAAGSAQAAKRPMNVLEKQAAGEARARAIQEHKAAKLKAHKNAPTTATRTAGGGIGTEVPTSLDNYLHVQTDSKGNVRIVETDSLTPPSAPAKTVEATDE